MPFQKAENEGGGTLKGALTKDLLFFCGPLTGWTAKEKNQRRQRTVKRQSTPRVKKKEKRGGINWGQKLNLL